MRRPIPVLSLLGTLMLLPACASSPEPVDQPRSASKSSTMEPPAVPQPTPATQPEFDVVSLGYASAEELVPVLIELLAADHHSAEPDPTRAVADTRTNSVLLFGSSEDRARIKKLLAHLDVPAQEK